MNSKSLFVYLLLVFSNLLFSREEFSKLYNQAEDIRAITLDVPNGLSSKAGQFNLDSNSSDQMKAVIELDRETRTYLENVDVNCNLGPDSSDKERDELEEKIKKRKLEIILSLFANDYRYEEKALGRFIEDDYFHQLGVISKNGNKKADDVYDLGRLITKYKELNPSKNLESMSFSEKEKELSEFLNNYLGEPTIPNLVLKEMAISSIIEDSKNLEKFASFLNSKLTTDEKIQLISNFGNRSKITGRSSFDVSLVQTKLLKELGFLHNYIINYKTINGTHSTVISKDPVTGKIVKFNIDEASTANKDSKTSALIQDNSNPDHGLKMSIFDSNGKPVTQVSSELGQLLKDATGGRNQNFLDTNYSLVKVGIKFDGLDGNLFTGKTSSGENIYGLAVFKHYNSEYLSLNGGVALSKISGERTLMNIDQDNLYARLETELRSPSLDFKNISTRAFLGGEAEVLGYRASERNEEISRKSDGFEFDSKLDFKLGVSTDVRLGSSTYLYNKSYINFYPDLESKEKGLVHDGVTIETGINHQISDKSAIVLDTVVMMKNYGSTVGARVSYENYESNFRLKAGYDTPISDDHPGFLPGGTRHFTMGVDKEFKNGFVLSVEYDRNLDQDSNSVFLKGGIRF